MKCTGLRVIHVSSIGFAGYDPDCTHVLIRDWYLVIRLTDL